MPKYSIPLRHAMTAIITILAAIIAAITLFPLPAHAAPLPWRAAYVGEYAYRTEDGDIFYQATDRARTSKVYYQTNGFTFTRCIPGTKIADEETQITIERDFDIGTSDHNIGGGLVQTGFVIPAEDFLSRVESYGHRDWLNELVGGGAETWVYIDAVAITIDDRETNELYRQSGGIVDDRSNQNYWLNEYNPYPGVYDKWNPEGLVDHPYSWGRPDLIWSRFNVLLLWQGEEIPEEEDPTGLIYNGNIRPEYHAWNASDEFMPGTAIPAGEDLDVGFGATWWDAKPQIRMSQLYTKRYSKRWNIMYTETIQYYRLLNGESATLDSAPADEFARDENGDFIPAGTETVTRSRTFTLSIPRYARFNYLAVFELREFHHADVFNGVYPDGHVRFTHSDLFDGRVPWTVRKDGVLRPDPADWTFDPDPSKLDTHIRWPEDPSPTIPVWVTDHDQAVAMEEEIRSHVADGGGKYVGSVQVRNDHLEINDRVILDGRGWFDLGSSCHTAERVEEAMRSAPMAADTSFFPGGRKSKPVFNFQETTTTVTIPPVTRNGHYGTSMDVYYGTVYTTSEIISAGSLWRSHVAEDRINPDYIKPGHADAEPVHVHTPVISPASIPDAETATQLVPSAVDPYALYQLILDNNYTLKFDPAMHLDIQGYGWSEDANEPGTSEMGTGNKYDEYVQGKWARFPFEVRILGRWREVGEDGFTEWVRIFNDETPFYIPSWSIETRDCDIEFRVESSAALPDDVGQDTANLDPAHHVATYRFPVQLSGIIYGFEVVGTDNPRSYLAYEDWYSDVRGDVYAYPFAPTHEEKKAGFSNRLGGPHVRYTFDGSITDDLPPENVLPMSRGTSRTVDAGEAVSGEEFVFSIKTIANLWGEGDRIEINPTFRWVDIDGVVYDDVHLYYIDRYTRKFIRAGNEWDLALLYDGDIIPPSTWHGGKHPHHSSFADIRLVGAINDGRMYFGNWRETWSGTRHDRDFLYTYDKHVEWNGAAADTFHTMVFRHVQSYCLSRIIMSSKMRTLTGKAEELSINVAREPDSVLLPPETSADDDRFRYSMQTWYGTYRIPDGLMVTPADTFVNLGIPDVDGNGVVDYYDYMLHTDGYVDGTEDFFLHSRRPWGSLVVNFDITTYKDGEPHLSYHGGTLDMWERQNPKDEAVVADDDWINHPDPSMRGRIRTPFPLRSGDVAVAQPQNRMYDWEPGVFMIN